MPEKIIPLIPCSWCGELFAPGRGQFYEARQGRRTYCSAEHRQAGRREFKPKSRELVPLLDRFMAMVEKQPDGCLYWKGFIDHGGYGKMRVDGGCRLAHHVAFFLHYGYWPPPGFETDHVCHPNTCLLGKKCPHRRCVNWEHLKLVPAHGENNSTERSACRLVHAARFAAQTHCKRGHEFTPENTWIWNHNGKEYRRCRQCKRIIAAAHYRRMHPEVKRQRPARASARLEGSIMKRSASEKLSME